MQTSVRDLSRLLDGCAGLRLAVVGDPMLDVWWRGASDRLCPEAPVPVLDLHQRESYPGGATNVACNLAALGADVGFVGVTGADHDAQELATLLDAGGVRARLVRDESRTTVSKTRLLAGDQILVRADRGDTFPAEQPAADELVAHLREELAAADAVLVVDYRGGSLPAPVHDLLAQRRSDIPLLAVDSHTPQDWAGLRPDLCTPNYHEISGLLDSGVAASGERAAVVEACASSLLAETGARRLAVTMDCDGVVVVEDGLPAYRTYARAMPAATASGAGDAFLAAFTLALAGGASTPYAAETAQLAATVAASSGTRTAVCRSRDLLQVQGSSALRVMGTDELVGLVRGHRQRHERLVFTNGCFDVLHRGHVGYLNEAKRLGDVLVVGVNSDRGVRRLKGPGRPVNGFDDRAEVLAALSCVDYVVGFDEETPERLIRLIEPDTYVKGGDYADRDFPEADVVRSLGGTVRILGYLEEHSTTEVIHRIRQGA